MAAPFNAESTPSGNVEPTAASTRLRLADLAMAAIFVAAALWARWPALNPPTLWFDDAWQALAIKTQNLSDLIAVSGTSPLFAVILSLLPDASDIEITAQLPALVAGLATPAALFLGARRLGVGYGGSFIASAIGVSSPVLIAYSARAKPYALDALLTALLLVVAVTFIRTPSSRRYAMALVLASLGVLVSGHTALLHLPVLLWITWSSDFKPVRPRLLRMAAITGVALSYYVVYLGQRINPALEDYWDYGFVQGDRIVDFLQGTTQAFLSFGTLIVPVGFPSAVVGALVVAALVVSLASIATRTPKTAVLLAAPLAAATLAAMLGLAPFGTGRTDAYLIPLVALTFALALPDSKTERAGSASVVLGSGLVVISVVLVAIGVQLRIGYPETSPAIKELVASRDSETLIVLGPMADIPFGLYSADEFGVRLDDTRANGFRLTFPELSIVETSGVEDQCASLVEAVRDRDPAGLAVLWSHPGETVDPLIDCAGTLGYGQDVSIGSEGQRVILFSR